MRKVLIIMSVYNNERYIREAIDSLQKQTFTDFELWLVNDGSTDGTSLILEEFAKKDSRVHIIINEHNLGLTKSLNIALRHAEGIYIARMDADDIALPERFKKQVAFLDAHPEIGMVGTAYEWIDEAGNVLGSRKIVTEPTELQKKLIHKNQFMHGSVMIRKTLIDQACGYDERYRKTQDYDLWLRLSRTCQFANLPEVLMQKRVTKGMISFKSEKEQIRCANRARWNALKRGDYPIWCAWYLVTPFLATILPTKFVRWVRGYLFGQKIYRHPSLS